MYYRVIALVIFTLIQLLNMEVAALKPCEAVFSPEHFTSFIVRLYNAVCDDLQSKTDNYDVSTAF